ncbi:hypothetical protein TARUN_2225 [Trichoderma arundinaceum]|uniref:Uncharacterized protein n=1 Tax=Trichoderma arundinaceum TaxID=490622 RepID=A0A395NVI3_TRIAR|nr:hypothetical protein TARUN_2225 [Trichoderma arundinaceum]
MQLQPVNENTELPVNHPSYLNSLLQQVLEAQKEEHEERDSDWKLTHTWWLQYLAGLIGVSTLGASITFGVLTTSGVGSGNETSGPSNEPGTQASNEMYSSPRFDEGTVRNFLVVTSTWPKAGRRCAWPLFDKNVEMEDKDQYGKTLVQMALQNRHEAVVGLLK